MINKVSEIVGSGHPDKVADKISEIIASSYKRAGIEVLVRADNLKNEINVAVMGDVAHKKWEWDKEVVQLLLKISSYYQKRAPSVYIHKVIQSQDIELYGRSVNHLSGDQEIIFCTSNLLHEKLKIIKKRIDNIYPYWDWKLLIDDVNKIINVSYSKSYKLTSLINNYETLLNVIGKFFNLQEYSINTIAFKGGTFLNDVGVTGRKIIADADGCGAPHGGGAFSGKDKTKAARAGRDYLINNEIEGAAIYVPNQPLNEPTIIKYDKKK